MTPIIEMHQIRKSYGVGTPVVSEVLHGIDLALVQRDTARARAGECPGCARAFPQGEVAQAVSALAIAERTYGDAKVAVDAACESAKVDIPHGSRWRAAKCLSK